MENNELKLISHSAEQTQNLGRHLGKLAQLGDTILLTGNLGSGKTCLTQGIAWGLEVKEYAFSPSFIIMREYYGRLPLYHIDLYRLESLEEIIGLGLEEYFYGEGICVIEWAERGSGIVPEENLSISFEYNSITDRSLVLKSSGKRYIQLLESLQKELATWN